MIQYPLSFKVSSKATAPIAEAWTSSYFPVGHNPETASVAIPPEFEGPGGGYSPEDFYALALLNCFVATFKVIAEKSKITYESLFAEGTLTVDRGEGGAPWMSGFHLKVTVQAPSNPERIQRLLEKTSQSCLILNSVKTVKTFEFEIQ